ncbi:MAG TPA: type II toxin-antitoxin system RelE/ParE family toxin [Fibrella sp.]|jgi:plasmid stabilization system protein ParE
MEEVTLLWEEKAKEAARSIYSYLYEGSELYADSWVDEVDKKLTQLKSFPEMGRIVPEFNVSFIREVFVGQYRLVYTYQNNILTVVTVRSMLQPLGKI